MLKNIDPTLPEITGVYFLKNARCTLNSRYVSPGSSEQIAILHNRDK